MAIANYYEPFFQPGEQLHLQRRLQTYGSDKQRIKSELKQNDSTIATKLYWGDMELITKGGVTSEIYYISGPVGLSNIIVKKNGVITRYNVYTDQLGSILAVTGASGGLVAEQNFDAWGRKRNPANWTYTGVPATRAWLYRGFTGHEHVAAFNLINMNGRMYDPMTGLMMSPDNYVPMPFSPGGYNRYLYANGNPLKFVDPDGEFFWLIPVAAAIFAVGNTVAHAIKGDIHNFWDGLKYFGQGAIVGAAIGTGIGYGLTVPILGKAIEIAGWTYIGATAVSVVGGLIQGISSGNWSALGNAGKILLGNFYLDENKSFFGGVIEGVSRFSWQSLQTTMGYSISQVNNTFGGVNEVKYLGGATFAIGTNKGGDPGGMTVGNFVNARLNDADTDIPKNPLLMHEYGHYIQSQKIGPIYPLFIMPVSGISALSKKTVKGTMPILYMHDIRWYEQWANRNAAKYFNKYYGVDWMQYDYPNNTYPRHYKR